MAKMLTPASASVVVRSASTPTRDRSSGPMTSSAVHGPSVRAPSGTRSSGQTTDSSREVRATQTMSPLVTSSGGAGLSGGRRQTWYAASRRRIVREGEAAIPDQPFRGASVTGCVGARTPSVDGRVLRHRRQQGVLAALAPQDDAPEILLVIVGEDVVGLQRLGDPRLL